MKYDKNEQLVEKKISSEIKFSGNLLTLYRDEVRLPNGSTSVREWVTHQGASAMLPIFDNEDVLLIRQFRYPLNEVFWEVPAGKIDAEESAEATANRELMEETGLKGKSIKSLGTMHPSIGYTNEVIYLYALWDLQQFDSRTDHEEFLITRRLPMKEAVNMVHEGEITDSKTAVLLLKAWQWWRQLV